MQRYFSCASHIMCMNSSTMQLAVEHSNQQEKGRKCEISCIANTNSPFSMIRLYFHKIVETEMALYH